MIANARGVNQHEHGRQQGVGLPAASEGGVEADGDDLVINGSKTFISNGINCDTVITVARDPSVEDPYQALPTWM